MRLFVLGAGLCVFAGCAVAQEAPQSAPAAAPLAFDIAGVSITLPCPSGEYIEVGDDLRSLFTKYLVPSENRVVSGYVEKSYLTKIGEDASNAPPPSVYAMIQVSRMADATVFDVNEFRNVIRNIPDPYGKLLLSTRAEMRADFQRRKRQIDAIPIPPGRSRPLGAFFSKPDAAGFGLLRRVVTDSGPAYQVQGTVFLRVRGKLLFGYIYTGYKGAETIDWLPKVLEQWADAILAANQ